MVDDRNNKKKENITKPADMKERKRPLYVYKEKTAHVFKYYILKLKKKK